MVNPLLLQICGLGSTPAWYVFSFLFPPFWASRLSFFFQIPIEIICFLYCSFFPPFLSVTVKFFFQMPIEIICFLCCSFFAACVFVYKKFNTMTQHRWSCLVELVRLLSLQYTRCCYVRCLFFSFTTSAGGRLQFFFLLFPGLLFPPFTTSACTAGVCGHFFF